jgi:autotransporter-associated beta strand protein
VFNGTAGYTATLAPGTTINAKSLTFGVTAGNVILTGGTAINISDPTNSIVMNTNSGAFRTQIIRSVINGTDITMVPNPAGTGRAFLTIGANPTGVANTFTGDLIFGGVTTTGFSQIAIDNPTALPATAEVRMKRGLSQLLFGGGGAGQTTGYTHTFPNDIILNDGGSGTFTQSIGAFAAATVVTLDGVISGDANLVFELGAGGGNGTIVLSNNATYTGFTNISGNASAIVRLDVNNALPVGTRLQVNRTFDMAEFNQQIGGLTSASANGAVTTTSATTKTLTISGNVTGTYTGLIGAASSTVLPGATDNVALVLAPTNTGTLTLSRGLGNTYNGGTTINGGRLIAAAGDPSLSATGTGPVAVNSGGTLGGTGGVGGAINVASGGHLAPGLVTGTTIGTLTALNSVSLSSGAALDIGLGAPAPAGLSTADRIDLPSGTPLTTPTTASTIGINLSDPAGGAAGNGTYTLMTFQAGQYSGHANAAQFFTNSSPTPNSLNGATITYNLADDANTNQNGNPGLATRVNMVISGGPNALLWTGAVDGNWAVGTPGSPFNFNNLGTGSGSAFASNDNVTFDDTGANTTITVAGGGVQPNIVTINNSTNTYAFSGGAINGSSLGGGGGLYLGGTGPVTISNNYTAAGPIVSNKTSTGTVDFTGAITAATSLTVNGGAVTLAGANTYTGDNTVNGGTLTASGAAATFGGGDVTVNAGSAAISAGVANAILNTATLTLLGGGTANAPDAGFISLAAGINEQVGALVLGTAPQAAGTYGATGSGATNTNDEYFFGSGIITVVAPGVPGDYNGNGSVDAADYVVWRNGGPLLNEVDTPGTVNAADYTEWRSRFGNSGSGAGGGMGPSAGVPEPATATCLVLFSAALGIFRRRRPARTR